MRVRTRRVRGQPRLFQAENSDGQLSFTAFGLFAPFSHSIMWLEYKEEEEEYKKFKKIKKERKVG